MRPCLNLEPLLQLPLPAPALASPSSPLAFRPPPGLESPPGLREKAQALGLAMLSLRLGSGEEVWGFRVCYIVMWFCWKILKWVFGLCLGRGAKEMLCECSS